MSRQYFESCCSCSIAEVPAQGRIAGFGQQHSQDWPPGCLQPRPQYPRTELEGSYCWRSCWDTINCRVSCWSVPRIEVKFIILSLRMLLPAFSRWQMAQKSRSLYPSRHPQALNYPTFLPSRSQLGKQNWLSAGCSVKSAASRSTRFLISQKGGECFLKP